MSKTPITRWRHGAVVLAWLRLGARGSQRDAGCRAADFAARQGGQAVTLHAKAAS